tara:strand:- start:176 stop:517 length:342 start_codon:yes stop_codon:yes gene_type:complete
MNWFQILKRHSKRTQTTKVDIKLLRKVIEDVLHEKLTQVKFIVKDADLQLIYDNYMDSFERKNKEANPAIIVNHKKRNPIERIKPKVTLYITSFKPYFKYRNAKTFHRRNKNV